MFAAWSTWNPIWRFPLTKAEVDVAVGLTWDSFWRPPLTKTKKIYVCSSVNLESHLAIPFNQSWYRCCGWANLRSLLATSFNQNQKIYVCSLSTWNPIWRFPLTIAEIDVAVGLTWDPIWRFPLTKADIGVCSSLRQGLNLSFFLWKFPNRFFSFYYCSRIKTVMILSSSTILLDFIKDSSCNNSKNIHAMIYG